ncbi:hypothetical protein [Nocardia sp. A7]|uniref:hypothetical protein n=1 Tax=Nocardia sp. A7 TaxID=2789274 RepID=UPI00397D6D2B
MAQILAVVTGLSAVAIAGWACYGAFAALDKPHEPNSVDFRLVSFAILLIIAVGTGVIGAMNLRGAALLVNRKRSGRTWVVAGSSLGIVATIMFGGLEVPLFALALIVLLIATLVTAVLPGTNRWIRAGSAVREPEWPTR